MLFDIWTPLKNALKIQSATIDNSAFRLHYRVTAFLLVAAALLVTGTQYFGDPIDCMAYDGQVEKLIDTFCWSHFTYSVVEAFDEEVGKDGNAYFGVKNQKGNGKQLDVVHHSYYQWVWFILFFQAGLFYFPRYLWKTWEGGRIKILSEGLSFSAITNKTDDAEKKLPIIVNYLTSQVNNHRIFVVKYVICEVANFVNVIAQIYIVDAFLGGEFRQFGARVLQFALMEDDPARADPMIRVFPRMTKCKYHYFGPSGDVIPYDTFCILPLNIINEKVFVFAWFWFVVLATLSGLALLYRLFTIFSPTMRAYCIKGQCTLVDDQCLEAVTHNISFGEWFLLYLLTKNVQPVFMKDILKQLEFKVGEVASAETLKVQKTPRNNPNYESKNNLMDEEITYV